MSNGYYLNIASAIGDQVTYSYLVSRFQEWREVNPRKRSYADWLVKEEYSEYSDIGKQMLKRSNII